MSVRGFGRHRPYISVAGGVLMHDQEQCRFVIHKNKLRIGCSDISIEALKFIVDKYNEKKKEAKDHRFVVQAGPCQEVS